MQLKESKRGWGGRVDKEFGRKQEREYKNKDSLNSLVFWLATV
jgi:hypothetical protein